MSKKLTAEERDKLAQEIIVGEADLDLSILGPSKKPRKSLKTSIEKVINYQIVVGDSLFWASHHAYLELLQSFLLKKIDGDTLTSKFFQLRIQDMINTDELCVIIEDQILPILDFYYTFKANDFSIIIDELYLEINLFDPNINNWDWNDFVYSESKLRSLIQENFVPRLQHSSDLNDSFFRP